MDLEKNFIEYRDITLNIMEIVKAENYEKLDEYFRRRQLSVDNIKMTICSQEELRKLYLKYDIENLEKSLEIEMITKKEGFLEKIKESQKRKMVMNGYNNLQAKAVFLSRKF